MTYDHWKTTNPADEWIEPPEQRVHCAVCGKAELVDVVDPDSIFICEQCFEDCEQ